MNDTSFNQTEAQEREHLQHVIGRISSQLAAFSVAVQARHDEARELVLQLQQNKADMDHVEKASMRQSVSMMTRVSEHGDAQEKRLKRLLESPYFGRIDIRHAGPDADQPLYIGIHSFYDPERDIQLVHDWRAPIASMFYEFELGDAHYEAPAGRMVCHILRKRQYRIERKELLFMLDTSLNIQDEILQEQLSRASDEKMRNIVATIQRDQNAIIRNDKAHTLIIQGAAGSGKTSIALHRIAFLLYKYKDSISSNDILIISPNKVFAHYISQVLPELGEDMIRETTMEVLAATVLTHQVKFQTFAEQVSVLLEHRDKKYAQRVGFKGSVEFLGKLDEYTRHVRATNFTARDIEIGRVTIEKDWIITRFGHCKSLPIKEQITWVLNAIVDFMKTIHQTPVVLKERARVRTELTQMFTCLSLGAIYKDFYTWLEQPDMFKQIKGGVYEYSDVFPLVYLKMLLDDTGSTHRVKHVVIDEMQDYTPVQYQVISRLFPCKKTILGDCNQSVSPTSSSSAESINQVLHDAECIFMHKSYRSTLQITELAQTIHRNPNLVAIERHGERPALIACNSEEQEVSQVRGLVQAFLDSDHNSLGIICRTQTQADWLHEQLSQDIANIHLLNARSTEFSRGVVIATAYLAKGIEFDQVIVPFCSDQQYRHEIDRHMLYVGCTRAMHKLSLTHTGKHSPFVNAAMERRAIVRVAAPTAQEE
ncbi:MAG: UvrD-helicase domain-containing protein [Phycisphaeraceae bacterium]